MKTYHYSILTAVAVGLTVVAWAADGSLDAAGPQPGSPVLDDGAVPVGMRSMAYTIWDYLTDASAP